jgi:rod shape determining protein RodA
MKRKYIILIPIIILISISLIYLPNSYKIKEFTWFIISLSTLIIINNFKFKTILKYSKLYYLISLFLLIGVLIIDKFTNGSRGWINIGPLSFQPSEFMKISLILLSIKYLNKIDNWLFILIYLIPIILIFLEPDTGAVIMLLIILTVFLFKKLNKRQLLRLFAIILFISVLFIYIYLKMPNIIIKVLGTSMYYRIDRLTSFISNDNLQTTNALISISTGHTLYFPEMFNDFFIAYILSQNIYMIIPILISTIWILIWLIKKNTLISQIVFYLFLWQFWWNIAMNLNLVPVIGIPYLFLSYGGSHLLSSFILISLVMIKKDVDNNHNN